MLNKLKHCIVCWLAKTLPDSCPFEREIKFNDKVILYIPPLCKLNPLYEEVIEQKLINLGYGTRKSDNQE